MVSYLLLTLCLSSWRRRLEKVVKVRRTMKTVFPPSSLIWTARAEFLRSSLTSMNLACWAPRSPHRAQWRVETWTRSWGRDWDGRSWIGPDRRGEHKSAGSAGEAEDWTWRSTAYRWSPNGCRWRKERLLVEKERLRQGEVERERLQLEKERLQVSENDATAATAATEHAPPAEPAPSTSVATPTTSSSAPSSSSLDGEKDRKLAWPMVVDLEAEKLKLEKERLLLEKERLQFFKFESGRLQIEKERLQVEEREAAASQRWTTDGAALVMKHHRYGRV